jgi:hypothetical protein
VNHKCLILVINNRHRPQIIRAIQHHWNDLFISNTTNHLFIDPIECELRRNTFNPIKLTTNDVTKTPTPPNNNQNDKTINNNSTKEMGSQQKTNNNENSLPDNVDPIKMKNGWSWSQLLTEFPNTPRITSLILIHPILIHFLIPSLPLYPQLTTQILQAFTDSTLPNIDAATRTRSFTWSYFMTRIMYTW